MNKTINSIPTIDYNNSPTNKSSILDNHTSNGERIKTNKKSTEKENLNNLLRKF
jgi:hypothetical protein